MSLKFLQQKRPRLYFLSNELIKEDYRTITMYVKGNFYQKQLFRYNKNHIKWIRKNKYGPTSNHWLMTAHWNVYWPLARLLLTTDSNHLFHIIPCNGAWTTTLPFSEVFWSHLSKYIFSGAQRYMLRDALIPSPQHDICFIMFCWFQNIWFGLFQATLHRQTQLIHSTTAAFQFTALN